MRRIGIVLVITLVVAACGSSRGSKATAPSKPSTATSTPTDRPTGVAAAGLIRPADLPGWAHEPADNRGSAAEVKKLARDIPSCDNLVARIRDGDESHPSPRFSQADMKVRDTVDVYASTARAAEQLDLYLDPSTIDCYRELFRTAFTKQGLRVDSIDVSPIAVDHIGDGEFGFRLTGSVTSADRTTQFLSDQIGVQLGKYAMTFETFASTTAQLAELETTLLPRLVDRMKQAGA